MITLPELLYHAIIAIAIIVGLFSLTSNQVLKPLKYLYMSVFIPIATALGIFALYTYYEINQALKQKLVDDQQREFEERGYIIDDSDHLELFKNPLDDSEPNENSYV